MDTKLKIYESVEAYLAGTAPENGTSAIEQALLWCLARHYPATVSASLLRDSPVARRSEARADINVEVTVENLRARLETANNQGEPRLMNPPPPFILTVVDAGGAGYQLHAAPNTAALKPTVLPHYQESMTPVEVWGYIHWCPMGGRQTLPSRKLPIHIITQAPSVGHWAPAIHLLPGEWRVPSLIEELNQKKLEELLKAGDTNDWVAHFLACDSASEAELDINVRKARYSTYRATNRALKEKFTPESDRTVEEVLREEGYGVGDLSYPEACNPLAVNILVTTKENGVEYAVLARQSHRHAVSPRLWATSLSETVDPVRHVASPDSIYPRIDLPRLAKHELNDEIGLDAGDFERGVLSWTAFAVGLQVGHFALLGDLKLDLSREHLLESFARNAGKTEVDQIDFIELTANEVVKCLEMRQCVSFLELHLALALQRRGHARVWKPSTPLSSWQPMTD